MRDLDRASALVALPGGISREDGRLLSQAELRPLAGYEEEWLADHAGTPSALVVTQLLSACLVRLEELPGSRELARRLLVGDRDYLMLQLRRITLGDTISAVFACPSCEAKMDVDVSVVEIPVARRLQTTATYALDIARDNEGGRTVRFRLPTGADQEAVLGLDAGSAVDTLLARCLVDDGGAPLSPGERAILADAMEDLAPAVDLELELTCPECGHVFIAPFDTTAFFFEELRTARLQLLREVHALALSYHWSEAEILGLTRPRRRAYLALLSDMARQD